MVEHYRLGVVERAVLEALDAIGARPDGYHRKSANAVATMEKDWGVQPRYAYDALATLAQEWRMQVPLVDGHGNFGSADEYDRPANARYTEARLSVAGALALAGERGDGPRIPVVLINGTLHFDGHAPPFAPDAVVTAVLAALDNPRISDSDLVACVGPPVSPTGCEVTCDVDTLAAGKSTEMTSTARIRIERAAPRPVIVVDNLPLGIGDDTVARALADRYTSRRSRLRDIRNESAGTATRIVCELRAGVDADDVALSVASTWGVTTRRTVQLPAPLAPLVRELAVGDPDDMRAALASLGAT